MRRFLLTLTIVVFLAGCAPTATTPLHTSGIEGTVTLGPQCPVEQANAPCPNQPYQATIVILDSSGAELARAQSDALGKFKVALNPGTYTLRPLPPQGQPLPFASEQTVTVVAQSFTVVGIVYDSGIR